MPTTAQTVPAFRYSIETRSADGVVTMSAFRVYRERVSINMFPQWTVNGVWFAE